MAVEMFKTFRQKRVFQTKTDKKFEPTSVAKNWKVHENEKSNIILQKIFFWKVISDFNYLDYNKKNSRTHTSVGYSMILSIVRQVDAPQKAVI